MRSPEVEPKTSALEGTNANEYTIDVTLEENVYYLISIHMKPIARKSSELQVPTSHYSFIYYSFKSRFPISRKVLYSELLNSLKDNCLCSTPC